MQKIKTIPIGNKTFTLKELPVQVIWNLMNGEQKGGSLLDQGRELLALACPELTKEAMIELYPSEIEDLWKGFEEVNAAFLGVARRIGLGEALIGAVKTAVTTSIGQSAFSLLRATAPKFGSTDTGFFSKLLKR